MDQSLLRGLLFDAKKGHDLLGKTSHPFLENIASFLEKHRDLFYIEKVTYFFFLISPSLLFAGTTGKKYLKPYFPVKVYPLSPDTILL